ncbi:MAG: DedA family protein [Verrucomicrobiaceae bacterium]|nr:MAG: DedA family protein [Verrucomicrobiaceae bacterium]
MRLLLVFVGLAVLVLATWLVWGGSWDERLTLHGTAAWIGTGGGWAWAAGIGLLAADLVLPIPATIVMAALGYVYGPWLGALFAFIGTMLAAITGYGLGRIMGEGFVRRWLGERDYERGRRFFADGGGWMVTLSRAIPILPETVSCMAGISRMPFGRFLLASACGNLPMVAVFAAIGASGKDAPWWAVAASVLVPGVLWFIARRWKAKVVMSSHGVRR